ncbi:hypothetical protein [Streptomyces sp. NPDC088725]|uniref:hypothetical protein n=1 Tax=Streptomyces sp. NPDC088725 TaxID=3365873 RepID=UPI003806D428
MSVARLPECATQLFDERSAFLFLAQRANEDWVHDALSVIQGSKSGDRIGVAPVAMFDAVTSDDLRQSLLSVNRRGAEDLLKLLAVGSFHLGPDASLREANEVRDGCVRGIVRAVGEEVEFFTNHGHAEDGADADFFASSFHFNSLSTVLYDVCLIAVSSQYLLVAWRFEDA